MRDAATGAVTPMPLSGSNVLRFELTDGSHIVVRPSGTEPKIKVYILTKGADAAERDANLEKYSAWVKSLALPHSLITQTEGGAKRRPLF